MITDWPLMKNIGAHARPLKGQAPAWEWFTQAAEKEASLPGEEELPNCGDRLVGQSECKSPIEKKVEERHSGGRRPSTPADNKHSLGKMTEYF